MTNANLVNMNPLLRIREYQVSQFPLSTSILFSLETVHVRNKLKRGDRRSRLDRLGRKVSYRSALPLLQTTKEGIHVAGNDHKACLTQALK